MKQLFIFGGFDGCKWLNDICILDIGKLEENEINISIVGETYRKLRDNFICRDNSSTTTIPP